MSSKYTKYTKKRKQDLDLDTSEEGAARRARERDRSPSSPKRSRRREKGSPNGKEGANEESLSIEETNKLRAKLGLAPLEVDEPPKPKESEDGEPGGEQVFTEYGIEIVHQAAKSLTSEKEENKLKERLEAQKQKRQVQAKLFKGAKGLAESDSEDDNAAAWVERNRKIQEERRKAEERAKALDEMDETFGVGRLVEDRKVSKKAPPRRQATEAMPAGLVVGHSREAFLDGKQTILVLQDKDVLDDDEDEVLINPSMLDDERHKKNVELKKKKGGYRPYEEDVDEFGQPKKQQILAKYAEDEEESQKRETFRLDETGNYDVDKEAHEMEMKRKLMMANKKFESLEQPQYKIAREFYTEEEMIAFRKPKKKKDGNKIRKRKVLKADDIVPQEETETKEERDARLAKLAARRKEEGDSGMLIRPGNGHAPANLREATHTSAAPKLEEGELDEDTGPVVEKADKKWKKTVDSSVNVDKLKSLMSKVGKDESDSDDSSSDGDLIGGANLAGVVVEDDEEEKEMRSALERARRLRQTETTAGSSASSGAQKVREMLSKHGAIKDKDAMDEDEEEEDSLADGSKKGIVIDATSEYYKSIGDIPTYGLAGNRDDDVDYSELLEEHKKMVEQKSKGRVKEEARYSDEEPDMDIDRHRSHRDSDDERMDVGERSPSPGPSKREDRREQRKKSSRRDSERSDASDDVYGTDYKNVLGEEKDVTKGVAAMLKLAGEKGYLQPGGSRKGGEGVLKHLESKRYSKVEQGRFDIEDKYMKKLERMGTTGTGPTRSFPEKRDYIPNVEITYTDQKGRLLDEKEAFRQLSWKFHGKGPGKRQIEKRQAKLDKKERLKKMNSMDTPLGTLKKQLKKQEQTQSAYLVLSGAGKDGAPLQKD